MTSNVDLDSQVASTQPVVPEKKKRRHLTEQERHEGWIENLRNEERTMKE